MESKFIEPLLPTYLERTKEHLVMGHIKINYKEHILKESVTVDTDEGYITIKPDTVNKLYKVEKDHFNCYNKFANISGKRIGSLISKIEFDFNDRNDIEIDNVNIDDKGIDSRCYKILKYFFDNDIIGNKNNIEYVRWIDDVEKFVVNNAGIITHDVENIMIRLDVFDLNLMGGTAGIIFGNNIIPSFITERATEYIMSDKVIVKSGSLEKSMSGISKINFNLSPVSLIPGWLLMHSACIFKPDSLVVSYNAYSSNPDLDPNGITNITFKFIPIESDSFYKNSTMFEKQNKFFRWAIDAAIKADSPSNVLNSVPYIEMKLDSLEINNNTVRNSEKDVNEFLTDIMLGLGFIKNNVIISDKKTSSNGTTISVNFSDNSTNDPNKYTHCIFRALL